MIVTREDWGIMRIFLDERIPPDFPARLLREMIQIARPFGAGRLAAADAEARQMDIEDLVAAGIRSASVDFGGRPHSNDAIHFDYVAGHRIKVSYFPRGILDDAGRPMELDRGLPVVKSRDFDQMYGEGALEGVIKLALM